MPCQGRTFPNVAISMKAMARRIWATPSVGTALRALMAFSSENSGANLKPLVCVVMEEKGGPG